MTALTETTDERERRNEKRREYYKKNRSRIRKTDNENANKNRKLHPERYRSYMNSFQEREKERREAFDPDTNLCLENNPDADVILQALVEEAKQ